MILKRSYKNEKQKVEQGGDGIGPRPNQKSFRPDFYILCGWLSWKSHHQCPNIIPKRSENVENDKSHD